MQQIFRRIMCIALLLPIYSYSSWYYRHTETNVTHHTFKSDALLTIDAYAGNITIIADQLDQIIIEATKRAVSQKALNNLESFIRIREHEGQIVTRFKEDSWLNGAISGYVDYIIRVPSHVHLPRIVAGSGAIRVNGVCGLINIEAGTGSVTLRNVVGGITVSTTAGAIDISCAANAQGIVDVKSNAGFISVEGTRNSVRASTIAGSISVKQRELTDTAGITLTSSLGAVSLMLPQNSNARLQAQTKMGSFYCSFPLMHKANMQQGWLQKDVDATIGEGGTALIKLATASGAIRVTKA